MWGRVGLAGLAALCLGAAALFAWPAFADPPAGRSALDRATNAAAADTFLRQYAATFRFRLGRPTSISVTPQGDEVLFLRSGPRSFVQDLYAFDARTGRERVLFTAERILRGAAEELTPEERARRERQRVAARGIISYQLSEDGSRLLVPVAGRLFVMDRAGAGTRELKSDAGPAIDPQLSPDGRRMACVRHGDLWVTNVETGEEKRLTTNENDDYSCGEAEFVAQEEMDRPHGFWWSPDSRAIAFQCTDVSGVDRLWVGDPERPERRPRSSPYPRPGRDNARVVLGILPDSGGTTVWVDWDRSRYPYLARVVWEKNAPLTILVQDRAQQEEALLAVDPATGATDTLLVERDPAWLNVDSQMPRWLEDGSGFLWTSEREGEWRLERHARDGRLVGALTPPGFGYRSLAHVDEKRGVVWAIAGADPTERQIARVPLRPGAGRIEFVTRERGLHGATFGKGDEIWVHSFEGPNATRSLSVERAGGRTRPGPRPLRGPGTPRAGGPLGELRSIAESPALVPRLEFVTTDDSLRFRVVIVRPRDFEPGRRYPVLVDVYAGPHQQMVQASSWRYLLDQWYADRGFVVVSIDGRGTPARGRAWERALRGSFIDVPLADQVAGLRALGREYPELDLERVGIEGWSYGGYFSALALLRRPDVFRAAVAGAPVTDWLEYDSYYTERYLGSPLENPAAYEESSVLGSASRLARPLLIVHGTDDDNVHFIHSLKLCDALFRAGEPFEFLPLSGFTHMVTDPVVTQRLYGRVAGFMKEHLGEPR
ncbi:MAG TPA: DPP IV N-terminal domain-containing protein [Terriglobales bacterium]|nr:DPP IV N-terminal domain-containing protein [Terriglobales bacterium]